MSEEKKNVFEDLDLEGLSREEKVKAAQAQMMSKKLPAIAYIALILVIILFSGVFKDTTTILKGYDFTNWLGVFGSIKEGGNFVGSGGTGARHGLLLCIQVAPALMMAMGVVEVAQKFGAIEAGGKLLSFVLRPLMGVPGFMALPMVASLTSSDAGAALNRSIYEQGLITKKERDITTTWLCCAAGALTNYISCFTMVEHIVTIPFMVPFVIGLVFKFIEANFIRFTWGWFNRPKAAK